MFGFSPQMMAALAGASVELVDFRETGGGSPKAFSAVNFGAAASDRSIFVLVSSEGSNVTNTVLSINVAGIAATIHVQASPLAGSRPQSAISSALVPTGTSGAVTVTFQSTIATGVRILVYRVTGITSDPPFHVASASNVSTGSLSAALNVPEGGLVIALGSTGGETPTLAGVNTDHSGSFYSGGSILGVPAETGRLITSSTVATNQRASLVAASFGAA